MDGRKIADAFEGIDEKYKREADIFLETGKDLRRKGVLFPIFKGVMGAAAAVAVVVGLLWLGQLQQAPTGTGLKPGSAGETAGYQQLQFPTHEDWQNWKDTGSSIADYWTHGESTDLAEAGISPASLFRQTERLDWAGLSVEDLYQLSGNVTYDELGFSYVSLTGIHRELGQGLRFYVIISPRGEPPRFNEKINSPTITNTVEQTEVLTRYWEGYDWAGNRETSFLEAGFTIPGAEGMGVRIEASARDLSRTPEAGDLISRCVGQILAGGVDLSVLENVEVDPLEDVAVEMAGRYAEEIRTEFTQNATDGELQECFFRNLTVEAIREDRESMVLSMILVIKPTESVTTAGSWWSGNTTPGEGQNEGYLLAQREILINKIDGVWQFGGDQTAGGITGSLGEGYTPDGRVLGREMRPDQVVTLAEHGYTHGVLAGFACRSWAKPAEVLPPEEARDADFVFIYPVEGGASLYFYGKGSDSAPKFLLELPDGSGLSLVEGAEAVRKRLTDAGLLAGQPKPLTSALVVDLAEKARRDSLTVLSLAGFAHTRTEEEDLPLPDPAGATVWAYPVEGGCTLYVEISGSHRILATALVSPYSAGCALADGPEAVQKVLAGEDPFPDATPAPGSQGRLLTVEKVLKLADLAHRKADGLLTLRDFAGYDCYEADAAEVPTLSESQIDRPIA